MDVILAGPGRAGLSLGAACVDAGHPVIGVLARDPEKAAAAAERLDARALAWDDPLPAADLLVIAVRDDAIAEVAQRLAPLAGAVDAAVHLSGLTSVSALGSLEGVCRVGSVHPLQTFANVDPGRVAGCNIAVTAADDAVAEWLLAWAESLGAFPFRLDNDHKALYHAAAAAASNYPVAALSMARRLFEAAGVEFKRAELLVRTAVDNTFSLGPEDALTGPAARGDGGTVAAQIAAIEEAVPELADDFRAFARAAARIAGTEDALGEALS